jgi:transcriptional regulator with XRE-family HTH domain
MSDFIKLVGERVRFVRKQKELTQEEFAEKSGLQYTYIGGIERGERNISLETLEKVAKELEVKAIDLFDFKYVDVEKTDMMSKSNLLDIHQSLLSSRTEDEIKLIHKTVRDIINLIDSIKTKDL